MPLVTSCRISNPVSNCCCRHLEFRALELKRRFAACSAVCPLPRVGCSGPATLPPPHDSGVGGPATSPPHDSGVGGPATLPPHDSESWASKLRSIHPGPRLLPPAVTLCLGICCDSRNPSLDPTWSTLRDATRPIGLRHVRQDRSLLEPLGLCSWVLPPAICSAPRSGIWQLTVLCCSLPPPPPPSLSVSAPAAIHATLRFDPTWSTLRDTTRPIGLRFWPLPPPSRRSPFSVRNRDLLGWALDHPEFLPQFTQLAARNLNRLTAAGFLVSSAPAKFLQRFTHPLECNLVSVAIHATFLSPLRSA